jgi:ABC-type transport system involved in cytochrome c biogenesis permease subunit
MLFAALGLYLAAGVAALAGRLSGRRAFGALSLTGSVMGLAVQFAFIAGRTLASGFLPFASRFESMLLLALAVHAAGLVLFLLSSENTAKVITDVLSAVVLAVAVFGSGFHPAGNMNPILSSRYFAVHILLAFAGYAMLFAGLAWAAGEFIDRRMQERRFVPRALAWAATVFLGAGILLGAFWADVSWGSYWTWDPKESWALLVWMVMVGYLHVPRPGRRWLDLAAFGLAVLLALFTFIGVNLLKWGMHRY